MAYGAGMRCDHETAPIGQIVGTRKLALASWAKNHASTESFSIHAIFQPQLFISVSTKYANKIVFVVNIWRVHSGVPAGLCKRNKGRASWWRFLRLRKKAGPCCGSARIRT
jgi:hypothetical protein